jgi:hypothetical protein
MDDYRITAIEPLGEMFSPMPEAQVEYTHRETGEVIVERVRGMDKLNAVWQKLKDEQDDEDGPSEDGV